MTKSWGVSPHIYRPALFSYTMKIWRKNLGSLWVCSSFGYFSTKIWGKIALFPKEKVDFYPDLRLFKPPDPLPKRHPTCRAWPLRTASAKATSTSWRDELASLCLAGGWVSTHLKRYESVSQFVDHESPKNLGVKFSPKCLSCHHLVVTFLGWWKRDLSEVGKPVVGRPFPPIFGDPSGGITTGRCWELDFWGCWAWCATWRIIPVSKWLVTPIYKPFRPFGMGITLLRGLTNHGY